MTPKRFLRVPHSDEVAIGQLVLADIPELMLVDSDREQQFAAIGDLHGPFRNLTTWRRAYEFLPVGDGGLYLPTTGLQRTAAPGVILQNNEGNPLALRPLRRGPDGRILAIGVDLVASASSRSMRCAGRETSTERIGRDRSLYLAERVSLSRRTEQCLWAIHREVLRQRCSKIQIPDVLLRQLVWGGELRPWPKNWRAELFEVLRSLSRVRFYSLRPNGDRIELGAEWVLIAGVEDGRLERPFADECSDFCPLNGGDVGHNHFVVHIGPGFLGVLEAFCINDGPDFRRYDFNPAYENTPKSVVDARKAGRIKSISGPLKMIGTASSSPLTRRQQKLLTGMLAETTRATNSKRPDRARIIYGDQVVGVRRGETIQCPGLESKNRYVTFGGNGFRAGMGYRIVGTNDRGWLHKCGYALPEKDGQLSVQVRRFLDDLIELSTALDLRVFGFLPKESRWIDLQTMRRRAEGNRGWTNVDSVHLRIYAPADVHDRLRRLLQASHFAPTRESSSQIAELDSTTEHKQPLSQLMTECGVTQQELAERLGLSASFVSQVLSGNKSWPADRQQAARDILRGKTGPPELRRAQ